MRGYPNHNTTHLPVLRACETGEPGSPKKFAFPVRNEKLDKPISSGFSSSLVNDFSCSQNRTRIRKLFRKTYHFVVVLLLASEVQKFLWVDNLIKAPMSNS